MHLNILWKYWKDCDPERNALLCLFVLASLLLVSYVSCECNQLDGTTWDCTGGSGRYPIQYFAFDDDEFSLYLKYDDCTVFQDGSYEVDDSDKIKVDLNGFTDRCETSEDNNQCRCLGDFELTIDAQCLNIVGPNGEICVPQGDCSKQSCSDGSTPVTDPDYEPSTNECGPSSIPFGAPEFAFTECCNQHDLCYPVCGKEKRDCDYEFYECMACACGEEYSTNVGEELCKVIACLYFQAVDEFGCGSYESSQDNGCICPNNLKEIEAPREYKEVPSKFGPAPPLREIVDLYQKSAFALSDFLCDAPFEPNCPDTNSKTPANTNSKTPADNTNSKTPAATVNSKTPAATDSNNNNNSSNSSNLVASILSVVIVALIALF